MTLGEFTGLLLTDFLEARRQADALAAAMSEDYHIDPLMNGIPVPHYTIEEAEIDVPVQIVGVRRTAPDDMLIERLLLTLQQSLPTYLYRSIKNAYYDKQAQLVQQAGGQPDPNTIGKAEAQDGAPRVVHLSEIPERKACYKASTACICTLMDTYMRTYLQENNPDSLQLMDFIDAFQAVLYRVSKEEFGTYSETETPYIDKQALKTQCAWVSRKMLLEFKLLFQQSEGLLIEPQTGKMNNGIHPDYIMRVHLKLREQDLDFIVDHNDATGESRRFLSLN